MAYGSVGCLSLSSASNMTTIDNEVVERMPGDTHERRCSWTARTELGSLSAVTGETCVSSSTEVLPSDFFSKVARNRICSSGELEVFFVGSMYRNTQDTEFYKLPLVFVFGTFAPAISDKTETLRNEWEPRPWKSLTTTNLSPSPPYQCCFATKNPLRIPQSQEKHFCDLVSVSIQRKGEIRSLIALSQLVLSTIV